MGKILENEVEAVAIQRSYASLFFVMRRSRSPQRMNCKKELQWYVPAARIMKTRTRIEVSIRNTLPGPPPSESDQSLP